jgi:hypothetical protein
MEVRDYLQKTLPSFGKAAKLSLATLLWAEHAGAKPTPTLRISVVIPAHNEERYLKSSLESLWKQNYGWFETIDWSNLPINRPNQQNQRLKTDDAEFSGVYFSNRPNRQNQRSKIDGAKLSCVYFSTALLKTV